MGEHGTFQFGIVSVALVVAAIALVLGASRVAPWLAVGAVGVVCGLTASCVRGTANVVMTCLALVLIAIAVWHFTMPTIY